MSSAILIILLALGILFALIRAAGPTPDLPTWLLVTASIYGLILIGGWLTYGFLTGSWLLVSVVLVPTAASVLIGAGKGLAQ